MACGFTLRLIGIGSVSGLLLLANPGCAKHISGPSVRFDGLGDVTSSALRETASASTSDAIDQWHAMRNNRWNAAIAGGARPTGALTADPYLAVLAAQILMASASKTLFAETNGQISLVMPYTWGDIWQDYYIRVVAGTGPDAAVHLPMTRVFADLGALREPGSPPRVFTSSLSDVRPGDIVCFEVFSAPHPRPNDEPELSLDEKVSRGRIHKVLQLVVPVSSEPIKSAGE